MLLIKEKIDRDSALFAESTTQRTLSLPFEIRQKARFIAKLDNQQEVGLQVERGNILRNGDKLKAEDGTIVEIVAGAEAVSTVVSDDPKLLARVCYHLGNRHVQLQVELGWCRYTQDHVLDEMVELLGASVINEMSSFEPEAGAYAGHHKHSHKHDDGIHASESPKAESLKSITQLNPS